jgi:glycogen debranching enzyme
VIGALHDAAYLMHRRRLPELFCGNTRTRGTRPVLYPVSCSPQAWASAAIFAMMQAVLDILPDAASRLLHVREPRLPRFLRELNLHGLRVGDSRVSLQFRRHRDRNTGQSPQRGRPGSPGHH